MNLWKVYQKKLKLKNLRQLTKKFKVVLWKHRLMSTWGYIDDGLLSENHHKLNFIIGENLL